MIIFDEPSLKKKKINLRDFTLSTPSDYSVFALHYILQILLLFNTFAKRVKAYLNIFTKDISIKKANQDHKKKRKSG